MTDHLADTADATARRLVTPAVMAALAADRDAGGALTATLRAFADAAASATAAAAALGVQPNTVSHAIGALMVRDRLLEQDLRTQGLGPVRVWHRELERT